MILGLLIVRSLPEEVEKVDMSRLRRDELQGKLREVAPTIMQVRWPWQGRARWWVSLTRVVWLCG